MRTARRSRLFSRVEQQVNPVIHGDVHLNGGVMGIYNAGRERLPRSTDAAARILFGQPDPPPLNRPSAWLDARAGVLPDVPRSEAAELLAWCRDPDAPIARLVTGAGGQGKTRLATQVCTELQHSRRGRKWLTGFVERGDGAIAQIPAAVKALSRFRLAGALLVVDYAEAHERLVRGLLEAAGSRVRVLVLARSIPDWWRDVVDGSPRRWADPEPLHLATLPDAEAVWTDAVRLFAGRLGRDANIANPPERFATTLDLYASALLRALDPRATEDDALTGVMRHERAAFHAAVHRAGLTDGEWRDLALSTAILRDVTTITEGVDLLGAVPELRGLGEQGLRATARALASAYPGGRTTLWRAPAPDRLADTHLLATAQDSPTDAHWEEYVHAVCATAERAVADHVAHVLTRALTTPDAGRHYPLGVDRLSSSLTALVTANPAYVPPLTRLDPVRFRDLIVERVAEIPLDVVAAVDTDLTAAGTTTSRIPIAVAVSRRLAATDPRHLAALSARLAEAGDLNAALEAAEQAVDSTEAPADRASALTALCHRLAEHDRPAEALVAAEAAAELRRDAPAEVRGYALHNLASRLADAGRLDEAVTAATEAAELLLAAGHHLRPRHAAALIGLAQVLDATGFPARGIPAATEAVRLLRELAEDRPDAYLPGLAAAILILSRSLAPTDPTQAADLATEAVTVYTGLAKDGPAALTPALAAAHMNLGLRLAAADRASDATRELRRAVDLHEDLAAADPAVHRPPLAAALINLALHRAGSGDVDLAAAERAVALQRTRPDPGVDLPAALADLGYLLAAAGRFDDARAATTEAVAGFRELLAAEPSALHRVWLADALLDNARHLLNHSSSAEDLRVKVQDVVFEAVDLYAAVEGEQPDTARSRFREAMALNAALDSDRGVPEKARRYCRRWREAVVRVPLPGMAALAVVWRTDRAPRHDRTRTTAGEEILGLGGESSTRIAPAAAQPGFIRLVTTVAAQAKAAAGRAAARPEIQPVLQYVQQHPMALARVAAVIAAAAMLLAAASPGPSRDYRADADAPPVTSTPTTPGPVDTITPPATTVAVTPPGPTAVSSGPPATSSAGPSTPPVSDTPPVYSLPTMTIPPRDGDVAVNVSGTSYREFMVVGQPGGWRDGRYPQGFNLEPGSYEIMFAAGPRISFSVGEADTVNYPSTMDAYLHGRDTTTLTALGSPLTINADDTSYLGFLMIGTGSPWLNARAPQKFDVLPGNHLVAVQGMPSFAFKIDGSGHVSYGGVIALYLTGTGTDSLAVHGKPVTLDLGPTSYSDVLLIGADAKWEDATMARGYRLIPGAHVMQTLDMVQTTFTIDKDGMVNYKDTLDPVLSGRGTNILTVPGAATTIDATASGYNPMFVHGTESARPTGERQTYQLLPGRHHVGLHAGPVYRFTTDNQGHVDYDGSLDTSLTGRGSTTLVVRG